MSPKDLRKNLLLSLFSFLFALGFFEGIARLFYSANTTHSEQMFQYDREKWFSLKPDYIGEYSGVPVVTNAYGYRDTDFPTQKPEGVIRVLVIGDSISFGFGVKVEQTYPELLERLLNSTSDTEYQVINTSVPMNASQQEYIDLERALKFDPDIIIQQWTLNDVTEPLQLRKKFGGIGLDYHGIPDVSYIGYLLNTHSALYRALQDMAARIRFSDSTGKNITDRAKQEQIYQARNLVKKPHDPEIQKAWKEALSWMQKVADEAHQRSIPLLILAVPFDFQFIEVDSESHPQKVLDKFAADNKTLFVDLLPLLQKRYESMQHREISREQFWREYFLDEDHFTPFGHGFTAEILHKVLVIPGRVDGNSA